MYPNWLIVEKATIRFKSFCTNPEEAATKAVVEPIKVKTNNAVGLYSRIGELLNSKYIPAVTSVAACSKADTGVGYFFCQII